MLSSDRFRRPREPDLKDYWDRLEKRLRAQMVETPPRKLRYPSVTRVIRTMARPALHGSMAMVMVAVVILTGRAAPTGLDVPSQLSVATAVGPIWAEVKEIADPMPQRSLVVVNRRLPRFVTLVSIEPQPWAPLPETNTPVTV
ncbi:MAG: hypothetical protein WD354_02040 [Acidimicrobiia bacterium]